MTKFKFQPVETRKQSEVVARIIEERVMADDVAEGDRLPSEQALTEEMNVSRPVVREALRILETKGLVDVRKGRRGGIFVSHGFHEPLRDSLSGLMHSGRVDLNQVFQARLFLEPYVAAEAARSGDREKLAQLKKLVEESRGHKDDDQVLRRYNLDFHVQLAESLNNPVLSIMLRGVLELLTEAVFAQADNLLDENHFVDVHRQILEAVLSGRADEARRLMTEDIEDVLSRLEELLEGSEKQP